MEEENVISTKKENYISGIIGAVIGGMIAAIPWIVAYVYGGMILSILAALIAAGEFYGYKIFKGKINKHLPKIIMILAIIIVTITTLLIIPGLLIQKEGINVSFSNIQRLYQNENFSTAIIKDYVISVIFTVLGASIITANIKKQLEKNDGKEIKLDLNNTEEITKIKKDAIDLIKPIFIKYNAVEKNKGMMKEEVLAELQDEKAKQTFNYLKRLGIIKKYKGKFYYSEVSEENQINQKKGTIIKKVSIILITILLVLSIALAVLENKSSKSKIITYSDSNVSFQVEKDWKTTDSEYKTEWNFYKYINNVPVLNSGNTVDENDYSSYPAGINVYYSTTDSTSIKSLEDIKTTVQESLDKMEDKADSIDMNIIKTSKRYETLKIKIVYNSQPEEILYYYYILKDDKLLSVTAYSFNLDDDKEIEKEADKIVNSFIWLK